MEKKKKEQWEKDVIKNNVALGIEVVAAVGFFVIALLGILQIMDEEIAVIFALVCLAIGLAFLFYCEHIVKHHAIPKKSILEEGDIESKNFEEFMDNVSKNLSDLPRKSYKYEDYLHDPSVLNQGTVYTYVLVQEKTFLKIFIFMYVMDFSKFDLKRDLTIIWNRICGEIEDNYDEIMGNIPWSDEKLIMKRTIYSVCVDKHTEEFQQYLDDNAGKYNKEGNGAFFVDAKDCKEWVWRRYPAEYNINDKLEAGICFETKKRYYLVPGALNQNLQGYSKMRKWFLEIMKDC